MKTWEQEMQLDENLSKPEVQRFLRIISKSGIPSIEEYAATTGKTRDDVADEYWDTYGDNIRAARNKATD